MKNVTVYIGHVDRDLGALRRNPERHLSNTLDRKLHGLKEQPGGLVFGHMETDSKRHMVVCVNRVPLDWPVDLDDVSGRHTGFHAEGPKAGKPKGVGPKPTEIDDAAAETLFGDVLAKNKKLADVLRRARAEGRQGRNIPPIADESAVRSSTMTPTAAGTILDPKAPALDSPVAEFEQATAGMPEVTEVERLAKERVGQDIFRREMKKLWGERCAITGLGVTELLRASHAKPWAMCDSAEERLDPHNGLLLAPHLDAAFDRGLIAIARGGEVLVSALLASEDRRRLGLDARLRVSALRPGHERYLTWHRDNKYRP